MRTIDPDALALGEAGGGALRVLITTTIDGQTYRFVDEPGAKMNLGGVIYEGLSDGAVRFSGVPDGDGMQASRFNFAINAAAQQLGDDGERPEQVLSSLYSVAYQMAEITVDFGIFTRAPGGFVTAIEGIAGRITGAPMSVDTDSGAALLTLECQSIEQDYGRSNGGTRGPAHCRRFYSADTGMDFIPQAVTETKLKWGIEGDGASAGRGGGSGMRGGGIWGNTGTQLV